MADEFGQIRPEREDYLDDIASIRADLEAGGVVYVEHAEHMTCHRLLIVPGAVVNFFAPPWGTKKYTRDTLAIFYEGHQGPLFVHTDGTDWVHYDYAAEKFGIRQWPGDAVSLANLINRLIGWGDDEMQEFRED